MTVGTFTPYDTGTKAAHVDNLWVSDPKYMVLLNDTYTPSAAHSTLADVEADEIADADYNPQDIANMSAALTGTNDQVKLDHDPVVFGDPVTISAKYAVWVRGSVAGRASTDEILGYMDLQTEGGEASSTNGLFQVDANSGNGLILLGA